MPSDQPEDCPAHTDRWYLRRLAAEARPQWRALALILTLDLLTIPVFLLTPIPLKIVVDSVLGDKPVPALLGALLPPTFTHSKEQLLYASAALLVLLILLTQIGLAARHVTETRTSQRLHMIFRARLFEHLQRLSLEFHDRRGTADSLYRVQYDTLALQQVTTAGLIPLAAASVLLVVAVCVTASIDWQLTLIAMTAMPVVALAARLYRNRMRARYITVKQLEADSMNVVQEVLGALRVVQAFGGEEPEQRRFLERSQASVRGHIRLAVSEGLFGFATGMAMAGGSAAVLVVGAHHVQSGQLTIGELLTVLIYLAQLYAPLRTASMKVALVQTALAGAHRAFELLDEVPDVVERPDARPLERARGDIELRCASFSYPTGAPILRELSLTVPAGTSVGIAGRTGAGKTTLVGLLPRFYDVTQGAVFLDGVDVRDYRLADLRQQFSIVLQEPVLFSVSIMENIRYGRLDAPFEDIVAAARAADAHHFIEGFPEGYDTLVGERGMRLSGGERQRIALARAFLKDAPILIMDEPTSAVDYRTEASIIATMGRLMAGRTTFMIAHRLETLHGCKQRIELEHGGLSAPGRTS